MTVTFQKHGNYDLPVEIQTILDKYAFEIHEFVENKKIRILIPLWDDLRRSKGNWTYISPLKDVVQLCDDNRNSPYSAYYLIINGDIIYNEYILEVKKLIELEQKYN